MYMRFHKLLYTPGFIILLMFTVFAVFAPVLAPHDPWQRFDPYAAPDRTHLLGTNDIGHDILSELFYGARISLTVGFGTAIAATAIGLVIGLVSGYYRGIVDECLMGMTDIVLMIPRIPLIIILTAFLKPSYWIMILVLGLLWWTTTARVIRSKTLQIREMDFVLSAQTLGFSDWYIMFSDILPNVIHILLPKFMLTVASAMIAEASLSFLGLGDPTQKSWGMMINFAFQRGGFINEMWWWYVPPGLCITWCVLSIVTFTFMLTRKTGKLKGGSKIADESAAPY
jgi:peptide/nickel transport system permease protein